MDEPLRDFADRFFRDALRNPENLRDFLMDVVPVLAPAFDFSRVNFIEPKFLLPNWLRREAEHEQRPKFRRGQAEEVASDGSTRAGTRFARERDPAAGAQAECPGTVPCE